jgi:anthranilate synthase component 2
MRILVLDNYDSFTYNLVHLLEKLTDAPVEVFRNDRITLDEVSVYDKILLSPGPGLPKDAGIMPELIKKYVAAKSILGVCLGHQAIGEAFGGKLLNLEQVYHGVATEVKIVSRESSALRNSNVDTASSRLTVHGSRLFSGLPEKFEVGRYHSWVVSKEDLPGVLEVTAVDENGIIMAMQHKIYDVQGVQFHPESILTPVGEAIIANWLKA